MGLSKEREQIFRLFLHRQQLRFSDIEKATNIKSNTLAYYLDCMQKEGILTKHDGFYMLSKSAEKYIPFFENMQGEQVSPLPVVLVAIVDKGELLLLQREKRPYKGYYGLIGGRMRLNESFEDAALRLVKTKTNLEATFRHVNAVIHEQVWSDETVKHSFMLFLTTVSVTNRDVKLKCGDLRWHSVDAMPLNHIIPSDLWMIEHKLDSIAEISTVTMEESNGAILSFGIN